MHTYYKFGLLLIFILSKSAHSTRAAPPSATHNSSYEEMFSGDYSDYYDENETDRSTDKITLDITAIDAIPMPTSTVANIISTTKTNLFSGISSYLYPRSNHVLEPSCPKVCLCLEEYKHILCNTGGLAQVPKDLPTTTLILDLSENHIAELGAKDFVNITKVREINLSGNRLRSVNKEVFEGLKYLQRLRLTDNKLTDIEPDTFLGTSLSEVDFSNNSIVLRSEGPFLTQPTLLKLACRNCSWTEVYDDTFKGLSSLISLKLDLNDFNQKINVKAFAPLQSITKLRLPQLEAEKVTELCKLLKTIDNISFQHFEISCFELVLDVSYNDSITLVTDPPYIPPEIAIVPTKEPVVVPTKATPKIGETVNRGNGSQNNLTKAATTKPTTAAPIVKQKEIQTETNKMPLGKDSPNLMTPMTRIENNIRPMPTITATRVNNIAESITVKSAVEHDNNQVHISQEMVNLLLICIIIVAVVGIIIGIVCRKDVGGIKTKCCRSRKSEPKDEVQPAEEIPLNKLA